MAMTSFSVDALQSQCLVGLLLSVRDVRDMCAPILEGGMYYKLGGSTRRSACDDAVLFALFGRQGNLRRSSCFFFCVTNPHLRQLIARAFGDLLVEAPRGSGALLRVSQADASTAGSPISLAALERTLAADGRVPRLAVLPVGSPLALQARNASHRRSNAVVRPWTKLKTRRLRIQPAIPFYRPSGGHPRTLGTRQHSLAIAPQRTRRASAKGKKKLLRPTPNTRRILRALERNAHGVAVRGPRQHTQYEGLPHVRA
ncbi:uncharacterized protein PHACADRAFT_201771 [Phanerochaete carnosa HHB-10118-sp]|uniref:Uncharacterized protein n=1 Tax=Phanerochaete carnosa (strain HHB-10118-sp) TaxID=650164 RepID=K5VDZ6_PHACS|nr:uncharacterized protein PHACADRAFT_201771 [Phanerochaete carnosa HHB-10118-sp]EKM49328.1 hypothetical protein PHACADRAFT_201771 [Phanerochaete carnosa HHB-10118-sp]